MLQNEIFSFIACELGLTFLLKAKDTCRLVSRQGTTTSTQFSYQLTRTKTDSELVN